MARPGVNGAMVSVPAGAETFVLLLDPSANVSATNVIDPAGAERVPFNKRTELPVVIRDARGDAVTTVRLRLDVDPDHGLWLDEAEPAVDLGRKLGTSSAASVEAERVTGVELSVEGGGAGIHAGAAKLSVGPRVTGSALHSDTSAANRDTRVPELDQILRLLRRRGR